MLIFWSSIPCVFCLYTLLKVVGYYDLSVLSMSVMGFQKKFGWGWVDGVSSIQLLLLDVWPFFLLCKAPQRGHTFHKTEWCLSIVMSS